jgi:hypothetical protein
MFVPRVADTAAGSLFTHLIYTRTYSCPSIIRIVTVVSMASLYRLLALWWKAVTTGPNCLLSSTKRRYAWGHFDSGTRDKVLHYNRIVSASFSQSGDAWETLLRFPVSIVSSEGIRNEINDLLRQYKARHQIECQCNEYRLARKVPLPDFKHIWLYALK